MADLIGVVIRDGGMSIYGPGKRFRIEDRSGNDAGDVYRLERESPGTGRWTRLMVTRTVWVAIEPGMTGLSLGEFPARREAVSALIERLEGSES